MTDLLEPPSAAVPPDDAEGMAVEPITQWDLFMARLLRHRLAMLSAIYLFFILIISFVAAPLLKCDKGATECNPPQIWDYTDGLKDDDGRLLVNIEPRSGLPFGTDEIGRDVFTRVIHGGQASLTVGLVTGLLVASLGTVVGALAGYYPGIVDQSLMRFTDLILGLPLLPVAIV